MSYLTYLLPLAAAAFVIWCAWQWLPVFSEQLPEPPAEGDSPPRRKKPPFSFAAEQDGKIWFCTATTKDVWDELVANPKFEATAWWPGHGWLILRGRAGLEDKVNDDIRYAGFAHLSGLGETYAGPNDPTLTFFSVEEPQAWICNHEEWVPVEL